jgi:DNA modification methylase
MSERPYGTQGVESRVRQFEIKQGDALTVLRTMESESVNTCVTSPPYFGLRDYGTAPQIWGSESDCVHSWEQIVTPAANGIINGAMQGETLSGNSATRGPRTSDTCSLCGAWRGSLGLEPTPEMFIEHLVWIFREVRRVLRKDGTIWVNIGDSYAGSWGNYGGQNRGNGSQREIINGSAAPQKAYDGLEKWRPPTANRLEGIKPKDLIGIPWMLAFALRSDGWWLRADIIWSKPNPMPESVEDRPSKAHEYIFLLSKSERYFYDAAAIAEPSSAVGPSWEQRKAAGEPMRHGLYGAACYGAGGFGAKDGMRNRRSVWTVTLKGFNEAHFATFPPDLIEPCILAGCPVGGTVLDPFSGAGTSGLVALRNDRRYIGIELNPDYAEMSRRRILNDAPLLNREVA